MTDPEAYLTCPYNPAHRILAKRMATHLVRCKKAQKPTDLVKTECFFNATHKIPEAELQHHLKICPDRFNLDKHVFVPEDCDRNKFPLPKIEIEGDENWDDVNVPAYNPEEYCKNNPIIRQTKLQSAAKRRDFRFEERQRIQRLQDMGPINTDVNESPQRNAHTRTAMSAQSSRVLEEDNPYTVEKLQEKVRLGSEKVTFVHSSDTNSESEKNGNIDVLSSKLSGVNIDVAKIGKGRGRNIAKKF